MTKDPIAVCKQMIGATIQGIEVDHESETVRITLNNGWMEFEGEGLELYVEMDELNS